jgi:hypothetical protein
MTAPTPNAASPRSVEASPGVAGARRVLTVIAWLVPAGVLVQATIAGQALFVSPTLFGLHGGIGHGVLLLAILTAGLAWVVGPSRPAAVLAVVAVLALIGQTGLGYVGHRSRVTLASSLHIPLGVAILGLTVTVALLITMGRRGAAPDPRGRA